MALLRAPASVNGGVFAAMTASCALVSRGLLETGGCPALGGVKGGTQCCVVSSIPGLNHPCPDADEEWRGFCVLLEALVSGSGRRRILLLLSPGSSLTASYTRQLACAR
jgi:hypothetical protein